VTKPWTTRRGPETTASSDAETFDDLRTFVTLSRTHPTDVGERHVFVTLDNTKVRLAFGESVTTELQPGAHHLRAHNTLVWKNVAFTLEPGEHLEFITINSRRWWTWGVAGVLGSAPLFLSIVKRSQL
jgi:hypothetical protein